MAVAGPKGFRDDTAQVLRVATKFSHIAKTYYASIGRQIDIIPLNGSIELAPILHLSDVIVDIVETGKTLLENNLEPLQTIVAVSYTHLSGDRRRTRRRDPGRHGCLGYGIKNDKNSNERCLLLFLYFIVGVIVSDG